MYQHGKKSRRKSNPKVFLNAVALLGVSLIGVAWILHKDLATGTEKKTTVPIVTEVGEVKADVISINEPLFSLELPSDWKQTKRVQSRVANLYEWHATKPGSDGRRLVLHIDILPRSYKITQLQPLTPKGDSFRLGTLSGNCRNFAQTVTDTAPVEAKWENITFVCDPIVANQTIGTGSEEGGIGTRLGGHDYFFYYEDHNIRFDTKIFTDILKSFRAH